jgi:lipoate-protein ligase A
MPRHSNRCGEKGNRPPHQEKQVKNKPTLKKGIVAASVVAGVAGGLVAGLALGVPGFAGASSNGVQGTAAAFAKNAVVQVADAATDTNTDSGDTVTELPGTITVQGSTDGAERTPRGPRAAIESDAVAKVLGMSTAELQTELRSGKSLADIAKAKGVDIEKVKQAIIDDFTAREQAEVAAGEHTQAEVDAKIADLKANVEDIVNGATPERGQHGPRGGAKIASEAVAKVLGLTADELKAELQSGKSLADIAKAKGVDVEKVKTTILDEFTAKEQAEVASGEHTQAEVDAKIAEFTTRLDDIVNGVKPAGMPGEMGGHGGKGGHGPRAGMIAGDAVAKVLGLTADELKTELQSGKSLADVATAKGVDIEKVKTAILAEAKTHLDEEVASGEHTQAEADQKLADLTARLDDIVNGVKPAGMPGEMGGHGGKGGHGPRGGHGMGGRHGEDGDDAGQAGGAPTLQGDVQVQPSGLNA